MMHPTNSAVTPPTHTFKKKKLGSPFSSILEKKIMRTPEIPQTPPNHPTTPPFGPGAFQTPQPFQELELPLASPHCLTRLRSNATPPPAKGDLEEWRKENSFLYANNFMANLLNGLAEPDPEGPMVVAELLDIEVVSSLEDSLSDAENGACHEGVADFF